MLPWAKECQEPPGAWQGKDGFCPRSFRESMALQIPWFGLLAKRNELLLHGWISKTYVSISWEYTNIWIKIQLKLLSRRTQIQEYIIHSFSCIWSLEKAKLIYVEKSRIVVAPSRRLTGLWQERTFLVIVLFIDCGVCYTGLCVCQNSSNCTLQICYSTVYRLYLSYKEKKHIYIFL